MNTSTLEKMKALRLQGMRASLETCLQTREYQKFTPDEFISHLIQSEWEFRENKKIADLLLRARFRYKASMENVEFATTRNLDKNQFLRLAECTFVDKADNILICGPTGAGKSYLASALGHQACLKGYKVMYYNTAKLFTKLRMSKADGSYAKELIRIERQDVLILDDFGLHPLDAQNRLMLLEIIEDRHGKRSTIIASQLPTAKWYDLLEEPTIADAIMDRIIHNAQRIELKGDSMRKKKEEKAEKSK
jgi:DNA replication protein DnaC